LLLPLATSYASFPIGISTTCSASPQRHPRIPAELGPCLRSLPHLLGPEPQTAAPSTLHQNPLGTGDQSNLPSSACSSTMSTPCVRSAPDRPRRRRRHHQSSTEGGHAALFLHHPPLPELPCRHKASMPAPSWVLRAQNVAVPPETSPILRNRCRDICCLDRVQVMG